MDRKPLGALPCSDGVLFRVWAPEVQEVTLVLEPSGGRHAMRAAGNGYFEHLAHDAGPGTRYRYRLDGGDPLPDPASRFQPEGVHGPSQVVDPSAYTWHDGTWEGLRQKDLVFYELHVGTFTPEGTFRGVRERLPYLKDLGITAVELMPVADFPGRWNWGYDHAALYAPSRAYGTPEDLRALVDAAHQIGLAVFLDVIYNHLGPDGAYVAAYAPLFTDRHRTAWGQGINLDDEHSDGVRHLFIDNALHWLAEYHVDGLRLDATDTLQDDSETHFLAELAGAVATLEGPERFLFAEDHRNLNTLLLPRPEGGYGLDGLWADNFHHQIRNMTAGDTDSYYADFAGTTMYELAETIRNGWYYDGRPSLVTGKPRGTDASVIRREQCVICIQNHDQVGNRAQGNRLTDDIPLPVYRAVSALLLFVPELPLLFMGQEWAAGTPFRFFTDHNPELGRLVTEGRKEEFRAFSSFQGEVPDPQDPETFYSSKLNWDELEQPPHAGTLSLYRDLLRLRRQLGEDLHVEVHSDAALAVRRGRHLLLATIEGDEVLPLPAGAEVIWHSEQPAYTAHGRPPVIYQSQVQFHHACALIAHVGPAAG